MDFNPSQTAPKTARFSYEATLRYSLEAADNNDKQLATWARSSDADAMAATQGGLREIAQATNPQSQPGVANWDHSNAEYWLWVTNVDADSFKYDKSQLVAAATIVVLKLTFREDVFLMKKGEGISRVNFHVGGFWAEAGRGIFQNERMKMGISR